MLTACRATVCVEEIVMVGKYLQDKAAAWSILLSLICGEREWSQKPAASLLLLLCLPNAFKLPGDRPASG